jgi:redox-sensitive bicupin YhaK (pirin superfamily)
MIIEPKQRDLGGFSVRRVLPAAQRRMVGPFVFFDHMGPAELSSAGGIQVRPHPHIGLATITYLFDGEIMHRDSLGYVQKIQPGDVNLMTAGRGIVHSERTDPNGPSTLLLHGIQSWIALPPDLEETDPAFDHHPADTLPTLQVDAATVTVIMGTAYGQTSPVKRFSPTLYLACDLPNGASLALPEDCEELAVYIVDGKVSIDGQEYGAGVMVVAGTNAKVTLEAREDCRAMVIGGANIGPRHLFWNFVSSSEARIEKARQDWREQRFGTVPGETEFIPLPE